MHFLRADCDFAKAFQSVLIDEAEFASFVEHLNATHRIVRTAIVKQFYKHLRLLKEIYTVKLLQALQVYYPDECLSFNDFARVCYFAIDRKATRYEKLTVVARLIS